jgi:excisionase family DNA binding protein
MEDRQSERTSFLSTAEIARLLNVDASTVKRWTDSGKLQCYKTIGGHRRFSLNQVKEFIDIYHLEGFTSRGYLSDFETRSVKS